MFWPLWEQFLSKPTKVLKQTKKCPKHKENYGFLIKLKSKILLTCWVRVNSIHFPPIWKVFVKKIEAWVPGGTPCSEWVSKKLILVIMRIHMGIQNSHLKILQTTTKSYISCGLFFSQNIFFTENPFNTMHKHRKHRGIPKMIFFIEKQKSYAGCSWWRVWVWHLNE